MGLQPFALILRQDGDVITGQINLTGWIERVAAVSGTISADGTITLHGGNSWPAAGFCVPAGEWRLESWNARFDARTNTIAGAFAFVTQKHLSSCYYQQDLPVNAMSMTLSPGVIPKAPFAGHWLGTYLVVNCRTVGWNTCIPSPSGEVAINLQLSQDGATVTGSATGISFANSTPLPVAATGVVDPALNLTRSRSEIVGGGTHTIRITRWSTARDAVGLLQGTFTYVDEVSWTSGPNQGTTWSSTYDAELRNLVKVPW